METWHLATDSRRLPRHPSADEPIRLRVGTWPIAPGQAVWVEVCVRHGEGSEKQSRAEGAWHSNRGSNSYWEAQLGPFRDGDEVDYAVCGTGADGEASGGHFSFRVGPKIHLALLWHQHQPLYKDLARKRQPGSYRFPWVRLHALRDHYGMAALLEEHPDVHVTINLAPVLLWQIEDYAENPATDRALEPTLRPAHRLSVAQREELLATFFEASWHAQIYPWPRDRELLDKRRDGKRFPRGPAEPPDVVQPGLVRAGVPERRGRASRRPRCGSGSRSRRASPRRTSRRWWRSSARSCATSCRSTEGSRIAAGDRLVVPTNCPGRLEWPVDTDERWTSGDLIPAGGAIAGIHRYGITLGPFVAFDRGVERTDARAPSRGGSQEHERGGPW